MAEFLVELYVPRTSAPGVESGVIRARRGAAEMTRRGVAVNCLRSIFVPGDETWFLLYEAASADDVRAATRSAGLAFERIVEAEER